MLANTVLNKGTYNELGVKVAGLDVEIEQCLLDLDCSVKEINSIKKERKALIKAMEEIKNII